MIEQREDGSLFSLSYGRATPPIDGNALIISTLDLPTSPYISLITSTSPYISLITSTLSASISQATPSSSRLSIV